MSEIVSAAILGFFFLQKKSPIRRTNQGRTQGVAVGKISFCTFHLFLSLLVIFIFCIYIYTLIFLLIEPTPLYLFHTNSRLSSSDFLPPCLVHLAFSSCFICSPSSHLLCRLPTAFCPSFRLLLSPLILHSCLFWSFLFYLCATFSSLYPSVFGINTYTEIFSISTHLDACTFMYNSVISDISVASANGYKTCRIT